MCLNVLQVLGCRTINITRNIKIIIILNFDLIIRYETGILRVCGNLFIKGSYDLIYVPFTKTVLVSVFHIIVTCIDHKNALTLVCIGLINDDNTGGDTRAVKEVGRQSDDALDISLIYNSFTDGRLCVSSEQYAVWQNDCRFTCGFERFENMQKPCKIAVLFRRSITIA